VKNKPQSIASMAIAAWYFLLVLLFLKPSSHRELQSIRSAICTVHRIIATR
jgi:hypothetical protein